MFFFLIAMLLAVVSAAADETTKADDGSAASSPAADKPAVPETVDLLDGADSAEGALMATCGSCRISWRFAERKNGTSSNSSAS